ncbi:MAG: hypothetical protein COB60_07960 [Flavobacteriaceae bacterium]|nr:MAG: hypothetical protein COB60_07960 [Flavobacteriaceae bacterium]
MKNKQNILLLFGLLCSIFIQAQEIKPNILFIAIDDLKPTVGAFGDDFAITPNMDKLAVKATVFLNNHTQQAVCGPSRASLMTGKRPDYTKVRDLKTKMRDINPTILSMPQYFKEQGYTTVGTGKIYDPRCVDKYIDKPSWSIPFYKEQNLEFPTAYGNPKFGYYQNKEIKKKIASLIKEGKEKGVKNPTKYARDRFKPPFETSDAPDEAYMDGAIAKKGIELIEELSNDPSKPFFLAIGFKRPHLPFVASQKYWDLYNRDEIELAAFQQKGKNVPNYAYHNSGELRSYKDPSIDYKINDENLLELDKETQRSLIHGYYAATSFVDAQVGKILAKLKEKGLDKNTIIVVWGDHGWHLGDHSLWNKHSVLEQATRSPLMVYSPFIEKGIEITSPTEFVDIFPTLCELADLKIPSKLDGKSLKTLIDGSTTAVKKYAVSQQPRAKNVLGYSFRTQDYRYTAWIGGGKKSTDNSISEKDIVAQELYDYNTDPLETVNLIDTPKYSSIQLELNGFAFKYFKNEYEKSHVKTSKVEGSEKSIKQLLNGNYDQKKVYVGATLNHKQLNTSVSDLFLQEFTYTTPENCAKQSRVHPSPNKWDWDQIDEYVQFAQDHKITVRLHGPISPQASKWAKRDERTAEELEPVMVDYMTQQCIRFNNNPAVRWMDVVNETVARDGDWFKDKPGVDKWENPWVKMGYDTLGVPLYITKAFEIANKNAPNISQVYNQHGGMEPKMWARVKKTILYLRKKGYRVDGMGWQAHLKSTVDLMHRKKSLQFLSELIDWAHAHQLDFHVTEIDYKISDNNNSSAALLKQAEAYSNVLKMLLSKRKTGVVTFNTWGMVDKNTSKHTDMFRFMFDKKGKAKPAYFAIKDVLINNKNN